MRSKLHLAHAWKARVYWIYYLCSRSSYCCKLHSAFVLSQVCQRMVSVYGRDDTTRIAAFMRAADQRYRGLLDGCTRLAKQLHGARNSLARLDRSLDAFLAWMSDIESIVDNLECESDHKSGTRLATRLNDIKVGKEVGFWCNE